MSIMFITTAAPVFPVQAASATVTVSSTNTEIHVGDTVEVILTIKADTPIGDFECHLYYDDSVFEFLEAPSCIKGGAGSLRVSDIGASRSEQERSYKLIFNAKEKGECRVEIYGRPIVYGYSDGTEMSVTAFSKTFLVYPSYLASADSFLSALHLVDSRIKTVALTPVFSPETTTYYASVPYEADSLIVSAIARDTEHATVQVFGDGELLCGTNEVRIAVTAEDGSSTEYLVYLYRAEPEPTETPEPTEQPGITDVPEPTETSEPTKKPELTKAPDDSNEEEWKDTLQQYEDSQRAMLVTIVLLGGVVVTLVVVVVWIIMRNRRQKNEG